MTPAQRAAALRAGEQAAKYYETWPFQQSREAIMKAWFSAKTTEEREALWFEYQALDRVIGRLAAAGQNAKVAAMEMDAERAAAKGQVDPYENA